MYAIGDGVAQDVNHAVRLLEELAMKTFYTYEEIPEIMARAFYSSYDDTVMYSAAALEWYQYAAEAGDYEAVITLGDMYAQGIGVTQNKDKARELYTQAIQLGATWAQYSLNELDS